MVEVVEKRDTALEPQRDAGNGELAGIVAIVDLGYLGLPVAAEFGKHRPTIGYDVSHKRIENLMRRLDTTGEVSPVQLAEARYLWITQDPSQLERADFIIIAAPTPITAARQPNLGPLESASRIVARHLKRGAIVIYESTLYPGATEELCVPILETCSGMRWREGFHVGYSSERVNCGDSERGSGAATQVVVAGDDAETLEKIAELYASVVGAGVRRVSSIRVAEAAKVVENTQRDLNLALANELAVVCNKLGLDINEVLQAAGAKLNFLRSRSSVRGDRRISLYPYDLTHQGRLVGHRSNVIVAGRRRNDAVGSDVARKTVQQMIQAGCNLKGARVNVLGLVLKENSPDVRHSRVIDIIRELWDFGVRTFVHDPIADPDEARRHYNLRLRAWEDLPRADALILAVPHRGFIDLPATAYLQKIERRGCLIDVKAALDPRPFRNEGLRVCRL